MKSFKDETHNNGRPKIHSIFLIMPLQYAHSEVEITLCSLQYGHSEIEFTLHSLQYSHSKIELTKVLITVWPLREFTLY